MPRDLQPERPEEFSAFQEGNIVEGPKVSFAVNDRSELYFRDLPVHERVNMLNAIYTSIRFLLPDRRSLFFFEVLERLSRSRIFLTYIRGAITIVFPLFLSLSLLHIAHTRAPVSLLDGTFGPSEVAFLSQQSPRGADLRKLTVQDRIEVVRYRFERGILGLGSLVIIFLFFWGQWLFESARVALSSVWADIEEQNRDIYRVGGV
jgi:hypothetical protein